MSGLAYRLISWAILDWLTASQPPDIWARWAPKSKSTHQPAAGLQLGEARWAEPRRLLSWNLVYCYNLVKWYDCLLCSNSYLINMLLCQRDAHSYSRDQEGYMEWCPQIDLVTVRLSVGVTDITRWERKIREAEKTPLEVETQKKCENCGLEPRKGSNCVPVVFAAPEFL